MGFGGGRLDRLPFASRATDGILTKPMTDCRVPPLNAFSIQLVPSSQIAEKSIDLKVIFRKFSGAKLPDPHTGERLRHPSLHPTAIAATGKSLS